MRRLRLSGTVGGLGNTFVIRSDFFANANGVAAAARNKPEMLRSIAQHLGSVRASPVAEESTWEVRAPPPPATSPRASVYFTTPRAPLGALCLRLGGLARPSPEDRADARVPPLQYGGDAGEEVFEFGELEWCRICAETGAKLLEAAAARGELDLAATNWGFSEEYCQAPERLEERFDNGRSVYWFMIHEGAVSHGASVLDAGWEVCLEKPGFHIAAQWGLIAHPVCSLKYDGFPMKTPRFSTEKLWILMGKTTVYV